MRISTASLLLACLVVWAGAARAQLPYNYYKQPSQNGYQQYPAAPYTWGASPGFYNANPYAPNYPAYPGGVIQPGMPLPAPVPIAGGQFSIGRGGTQFNFW